MRLAPVLNMAALCDFLCVLGMLNPGCCVWLMVYNYV